MATGRVTRLTGGAGAFGRVTALAGGGTTTARGRVTRLYGTPTFAVTGRVTQLVGVRASTATMSFSSVSLLEPGLPVTTTASLTGATASGWLWHSENPDVPDATTAALTYRPPLTVNGVDVVWTVTATVAGASSVVGTVTHKVLPHIGPWMRAADGATLYPVRSEAQAV